MPAELEPPAANTVPSAKSVKDENARATFSEPVDDQFELPLRRISAAAVGNTPAIHEPEKAAVASKSPCGRGARNDCTNSAHAVPRAVCMAPTGLHTPVAGSYTSVLGNTAKLFAAPFPPATSTRPFGNRAALWRSLGAFMLPVGFQELVAGLNNAAVLNTPPHRLPPPATRTRPSCRRTAIGALPTTIGRFSVGDHRPVAGLNVSAVAFKVHCAYDDTPPTTR